MERGAIVCVTRDEVVQALNKMKTGIVLGPDDVSLELIVASGEEEIPVERALYIMAPILKGRMISGLQLLWSFIGS